VTKSYASSGSSHSPEGGIELAQKVRPNNSFKPTLLRGAALFNALGGMLERGDGEFASSKLRAPTEMKHR
jgi:hypothetical protein